MRKHLERRSASVDTFGHRSQSANDHSARWEHASREMVYRERHQAAILALFLGQESQNRCQ